MFFASLFRISTSHPSPIAFAHPQLVGDDRLHLTLDVTRRHLQPSKSDRVRIAKPIQTAGAVYPTPPPNPTLAYMYMPPFTLNTSPVMYDAASLARNATALATSSAVPSRASGIASINRALTGSPHSDVMSVSIRPGETAFTRIFREPNSLAIDLVRPINPALDAL